jgi:tetratricopeptide (TPR) repeat protein
MKKLTIIALVVTHFLLITNCFAKDIPTYINKLVFQGGRFNESIDFCFGDQDNINVFESSCNKYVSSGGLNLQPVIVTWGYNKNKKIISYLVSNGLAEIRKCSVYNRYKQKMKDAHFFLFYTNKFKEIANDKWCINIGKRVLKSINYTNEYKGSPSGIEMTFYALTFTYRIEGNLPNLLPLNKNFEGKAKAYLDPDDGKWKLINLSLSDSGKSEFKRQIEAQFDDYKPRRDKTISSSQSDKYAQKGLTYLKQKSYSKAIESLTKAIKIKPDNYQAHSLRGVAYKSQGNYSQAIQDYTKAIKIKPDFHIAYRNRGYAYSKQGNYSQAIQDYTKAIKIKPNHPSAYNSLAWVYATAKDESYRDGAKAVKFALKAIGIQKKAAYLDTLAAAYVENQKYENAVKAYKNAIQKDNSRLKRYKKSLKERGYYSGPIDSRYSQKFESSLRAFVMDNNYL